MRMILITTENNNEVLINKDKITSVFFYSKEKIGIMVDTGVIYRVDNSFKDFTKMLAELTEKSEDYKRGFELGKKCGF